MLLAATAAYRTESRPRPRGSVSTPARRRRPRDVYRHCGERSARRFPVELPPCASLVLARRPDGRRHLVDLRGRISAHRASPIDRSGHDHPNSAGHQELWLMAEVAMRASPAATTMVVRIEPSHHADCCGNLVLRVSHSAPLSISMHRLGLQSQRPPYRRRG